MIDMRAEVERIVAERTEVLTAALRRAERDLEAIVNDERGTIDPQFALDRVRDALVKRGAA